MKKFLTFTLILLAPVMFSACDNVKTHTVKVDLEKMREEQNKKADENPEMKNVFKVKLDDGQEWIYYLGADGKRYIFPNEGTYKSWFGDQKVTNEKTLDEIANIPIGGNVTYRPGFRLLKTDSVDEIFFVAPGGVLRAISPDVAKQVYGDNWQEFVDVIENYYFTNYKIGKPINSLDDVPVVPENWTINDDKNLF